MLDKQLSGHLVTIALGSTVQFTEEIATDGGGTLLVGTIATVEVIIGSSVQISVEWYGEKDAEKYLVKSGVFLNARKYKLPKNTDYVQIQLPGTPFDKSLAKVVSVPTVGYFATVLALKSDGTMEKALVAHHEMIPIPVAELTQHYSLEEMCLVADTFVDFVSSGQPISHYDIPAPVVKKEFAGLNHVEGCVVNGALIQLIEPITTKTGGVFGRGDALKVGKATSHGWIEVTYAGYGVGNPVAHKVKRDSVRAVPYVKAEVGSCAVTNMPGYSGLDMRPAFVLDLGYFHNVLIHKEDGTVSYVNVSHNEIFVIKDDVAYTTFGTEPWEIMADHPNVAKPMPKKIKISKKCNLGLMNKVDMGLPGTIYYAKEFGENSIELTMIGSSGSISAPKESVPWVEHKAAQAGSLIEYHHKTGAYFGSPVSGKVWLGVVAVDAANDTEDVAVFLAPGSTGKKNSEGTTLKLKINVEDYVPIDYLVAVEKYPATEIDHLFLEHKNFKKFAGVKNLTAGHFTNYKTLGKAPLEVSAKNMVTALNNMNSAMGSVSMTMHDFGDTINTYKAVNFSEYADAQDSYIHNQWNDYWTKLGYPHKLEGDIVYPADAKIYSGVIKPHKNKLFKQINEPSPEHDELAYGDHWYNIDTMITKVWMGNVWVTSDKEYSQPAVLKGVVTEIDGKKLDSATFTATPIVIKSDGIKVMAKSDLSGWKDEIKSKAQAMDKYGNIVPTGGITSGMLPLDDDLGQMKAAEKSVEFEVGDVVKLMNPLKPSSMEGYGPGAMMVVSKVLKGDEVKEQGYVEGDPVYYAGPLDHDPSKWTRHGGYQIYVGSEFELFKKAKK